MIPAIAQTLANMLSGGTSSIHKQQIYFNHPSIRQGTGSCLNLYCYDLQNYDLQQSSYSSGTQQVSTATQPVDSSGSSRMPVAQAVCANHPDSNHPELLLSRWVEVSFMVSTCDFTAFGEQQLLSEALKQLSIYDCLPEELLAPALRGYGKVPINVFSRSLADSLALWRALNAPMRPAIHITVTIPLDES